jgi:WD40 repeat protein
MRNALIALCMTAALALGFLAGCASTEADELARQRAAKLKEERDIARAREEQERRIAERKAAEEAGSRAQGEPAKEEGRPHLVKKDTIEVSSAAVTAIAISPDGNLLACGTADGGLKVFEVGGGLKMAAKEHTAAVKSLLFSNDSSTLYSGGADEALIIWEPTSPKPKKKVRGFFKTLDALSSSPDGTRLAAGDGKRVYILDTQGHTVKKLNSEAYGLHAVLFTADGEGVISGSDRKLVEVWDISAESHKHSLKLHSESVTCLAIDSEGKEVISGGADKMLVSWNIEKGERIRVFHGHRTTATDVVYANDGKHIFSSDAKGVLIVWNRATGKSLSKTQAHEKSVEGIALAGDGKTLYAGSADGTVSTWEVNLEQ